MNSSQPIYRHSRTEYGDTFHDSDFRYEPSSYRCHRLDAPRFSAYAERLTALFFLSYAMRHDHGLPLLCLAANGRNHGLLYTVRDQTLT